MLRNADRMLRRQEAVPGGDADDGSTFEMEVSPTSRGDGSTDLSWSSTPVSSQPPALHKHRRLFVSTPVTVSDVREAESWQPNVASFIQMS